MPTRNKPGESENQDQEGTPQEPEGTQATPNETQDDPVMELPRTNTPQTGQVRTRAAEEGEGEKQPDALADARSVLDQNEDDQQRSRTELPAPEMPGLVPGMIPPGTPRDNPAVLGRAVAAANDREIVRRHALAQERQPFGVTGDTRGMADDRDADGLVMPGDAGRDMLSCPNCGREWEYQQRWAGSSIPCGCGTLVAVPIPASIRS